ncbi:glycosyltransferase [Marinicauda algicola]|uniref:Glycosyltransferase n=1 Tax=Marinicauda algicola TaxID=2029849 RepID=A0A4S2H3X7_9PROT|nr:glycosyltransferase family 2 protein [Marinicauda algicola]TGY90294.1 glycosyltransferase [Marinicauda algicola]
MTTHLKAPHVPACEPDVHAAEIAVIVPVYKGEAFVTELCSRLHRTLSDLTADYQIVLVDDRSPDGSWPLIEQEAAKDARVLGVRLSRNFGQHPAISAGIAHARAKWYVVMDCDLQDPPEAIADLYAHAVETETDCVIAERESSGLGAGRNIGSAIFNAILRWASGLNVSNKYGNFRIISARVAFAFRQYPEQLRLFPAIMSQVGFDTRYLILPRQQRAVGKSSYNLAKLGRLALETIVAYSEKPLWWMIGLGLVVCALSFLFGLSVVVNALLNGTAVPGYATLASLLAFLGGIQIFLVSLVGLYVGRALAEAKRRPIFIVDILATGREGGRTTRDRKRRFRMAETNDKSGFDG